MSDDPHVVRFFCFLSVFTFFMLFLITSDNFLQLFLGWEGVGLASYMLINFWFKRIKANKAALKAMFVNRIGDFGLLIALVLLFKLFKSLNFFVIFSLTYKISHIYFCLFNFNFNILLLINMFIFLGVIGKSAQLGLHTWLPDAMEGPTPVSALIHAATMVTAGVFLLIRCSCLFEFSILSLSIVSFLGALTAFFGATVAFAQNDLKKIIAYSTCSQLGYMVFACGLSNYNVALFHLLNHAIFKALLFLCAGALIHLLDDEQDLRRMGGLLNLYPFLYLALFIGSSSLMGFLFLSGFYSKDLIIELSLINYSNLLLSSSFFILLATIFTFLYSFKILYFVFLSKPNFYLSNLFLMHTIPMPIFIVLFLLSFCSLFSGYFFNDILVGIGTYNFGSSIFFSDNKNFYSFIDLEFFLIYWKCVPLIFGTLSKFIIIYFYVGLNRLNFFKFYYYFILLTFFSEKWYFDYIYNNFIAKCILNLSYTLFFKNLDKGFLDFFGKSIFIKLFSLLSIFISYLHIGFLYHSCLFLLTEFFFIFIIFLFLLFLFYYFYFIIILLFCKINRISF